MSAQPYTRKLVTIQKISAITDIPGADLTKKNLLIRPTIFNYLITIIAIH